MTNINAEAVEFEIKRLQDCCAAYRDEIEQLQHKIRDLEINLDMERRPIYCKICGSCGESGCCKPEMCKVSGHKHCLYPVLTVGSHRSG